MKTMNTYLQIIGFFSLLAGGGALVGALWWLAVWLIFKARYRHMKVGYFYDAIREYRKTHPEDKRHD